jgi:DNA repair exonuclease SbcCD ATPase subunit
LGEVAKKEAERRKAQPSAGKVYTNKDLPAAAQKPVLPAPGPEATPVDPVAAATAQPSPEPPKPEGEQRDEAWWKARIGQAREELRRNQMFAEALQSRINALTRDFTNAFNAPKQRAIGQQRAEAVAELSRVAQDIERAKTQIAEIEEEARKAGVPPGWLR